MERTGSRKLSTDEREWRFVPRLVETKEVQYRLPYRDYIDQNSRTQADRVLGETSPLCFEPEDIKYIVIDNENEILPLLNQIEKSKGGKYNYNDVRMLSTKILRRIKYTRICESNHNCA